MVHRIRVKVCCIQNQDEANLAVSKGVDALGLVGPMPSGPGVISNETIHQISRAISPPTATFLLTSETTASGILQHHQKVRTSVIQLVDEVDQKDLESLREELPGIKLVQVIHVSGSESIEAALEVSSYIDALLLDSGNPNLDIKELGGTGRTHNWEISRAIVEQSSKPVFLAGGLNPDNVSRAIDFVRPFGVDVCSGLRRGGKLDSALLDSFLQAIG